MFYYPIISSSIEKDNYRQKVKRNLEDLKENLNKYIEWNNRYNTECMTIGNIERNNNYLELQELVNKILN